MTLTSRFSTLLCTIALLASATAARADIIDFTGAYAPGTTYNLIDMGDTAIGQSGSLFNFYFTNPGAAETAPSIGLQTGYIPANSRIDFTFSGFSSSNNGYGVLQGNYNNFSGGDIYTGNAYADTLGGFSTNSTVNGTPNPFQLFAIANIDEGTITGTFVNNSPIKALFSFYEFAILGLEGTASATYAVSLSAVPLPAALPMFASLLMGAFGFGRFKKRKAMAA